jgi:ribosomal protein S18 acetylase RimI-like enzyme
LTTRIRLFHDKDYWLVEDLVRKFMNNDPYSPPNIVRQMQSLFGSLFFVAFDDDSKDEEILGYIMGGIELDNEKKGWILEIFVKEEHRNQGIGYHLVEALVRQMEKKEIVEIFLTTDTKNFSALQIYKKNGFEIVSCLDEYYRKGKEVYLMKCLVV